MSPAELLAHLEARHNPLTPEERENTRQFMIKELCEWDMGGYEGEEISDPTQEQLKELEQIYIEEHLRPAFEKNGSMRDREFSICHNPSNLTIINLIIDFQMSQLTNFQLRFYAVAAFEFDHEASSGCRPLDNRTIVLKTIQDYSFRENWEEVSRMDLNQSYPPVSHPDFDFLMNYLRTMAQKDSDRPSKSSKTRKKVGDILGKKK
jgi:hypothetical protein